MEAETRSPRRATAGRVLPCTGAQHGANQTTSRRNDLRGLTPTIKGATADFGGMLLVFCACIRKLTRRCGVDATHLSLAVRYLPPSSAQLGIESVRNTQREPERSILRLRSGHVTPERSGTSRSQMPARQPEQTAEGGGEGGGGEERRGWGQRSGGGTRVCLCPLRPLFQTVCHASKIWYQ